MKSRRNIGRKKPKKPKKTKKQKGGSAPIIKTDSPVCSPNATVENEKSSNKYNPYKDSCFNVKQLKKIAQKLNKNTQNQSKKIKIKSNKQELVSQINDNFCKNYGNIDFCILHEKKWKGDQDILDAIRKSFAPPRPKGKYQWLNSIDIRDVMDQYEEKYPKFKFLGPVPIDFQEIGTEVGNLNLKHIKPHTSQIGIIFNTDPHDQPGEHWISMFIDLVNNTICFFDSTGDEPPKQVVNLIEKLVKQSKNLGITSYLKPVINKHEHQLDNSECGVYSLYFILQRLKGNSCEDIFKKKVHDEEMNKNRKVFFTDSLPLILESFKY
jgi:hypothetical protein